MQRIEWPERTPPGVGRIMKRETIEAVGYGFLVLAKIAEAYTETLRAQRTERERKEAERRDRRRRLWSRLWRIVRWVW